jgi:DNA uptake protein ComE-like DNA-binding protein
VKAFPGLPEVGLKSTRSPWIDVLHLVALVVMSSNASLALSQTQTHTQTQTPVAPQAVPAPAKKPAPKPQKKIDINNASLSELRTLPLGEPEAKLVIAHRPYRAKGELMTKAGLPEGVYFTIKDRIQLQEPRKAASKK